MILDKYDDLRLILANMMRDDKQCDTLGKGSDNMEKYLQQIVKFFGISDVSVRLACERLKKAYEISPIVGALGYGSSYDLQNSIHDYKNVINSTDVEYVVAWLLDKGYNISIPNEL